MKEYPARTFKSGNSTALRLPKELGIVPGEEMCVLRVADDRLLVWRRRDSKAKFLALAGAMSPGFMSDGRVEDGDPARDWSTDVARQNAA